MGKILNKNTGQIIFEAEGQNIKETIVTALENKISLKESDLRNLDLRGLDLKGADLRFADLSSSDLSSIDNGAGLLGDDVFHDYYETNLSEANLSGANLFEAKLNEAKLYGTNLTGVNLENADLFGADIRGANLSQANLDNTNFNCCAIGSTIFGLTDLTNSLNLEDVFVYGKCSVDFETLKESSNIPKVFLNKLGISELAPKYIQDLSNENPIKLFPVFLSHSWNDKEFTRKLYNELHTRDVKCWFDEKETKPGERIVSAITRGISLYDKMILICSKDSLTSWWVEREIDRILMKEKEFNAGKEEHERVNLLIPITLDDYVFNEWKSPWATEIKRYIIGDFREWKNYLSFNDSLNKLISGLEVSPNNFIPPSYLPQNQ